MGLYVKLEAAEGGIEAYICKAYVVAIEGIRLPDCDYECSRIVIDDGRFFNAKGSIDDVARKMGFIE